MIYIIYSVIKPLIEYLHKKIEQCYNKRNRYNSKELEIKYGLYKRTNSKK